MGMIMASNVRSSISKKTASTALLGRRPKIKLKIKPAKPRKKK